MANIKEVRVERIAPITVVAKTDPSQVHIDEVLEVSIGHDHCIYFLKKAKSSSPNRPHGMFRWPLPMANVSTVESGGFGVTAWLGHDVRAFCHLQPLRFGRFLMVSRETDPSLTRTDLHLGVVIQLRSAAVVRAEWKKGILGVEYELDLGCFVSGCQTTKDDYVWVSYAREGLEDETGHAARSRMRAQDKYPVRCYNCETGQLLYQLQSGAEILYAPSDIVAISTEEVMFTHLGSIYYFQMEPGGGRKGSSKVKREMSWKGLIGDTSKYEAWAAFESGGEFFVMLQREDTKFWNVAQLCAGSATRGGGGGKIVVETVAVRDDTRPQPKHVDVIAARDGHLVCADLGFAKPKKKKQRSPRKGRLVFDELEDIMAPMGKKPPPLQTWFWGSHLLEHVDSIFKVDRVRAGCTC